MTDVFGVRFSSYVAPESQVSNERIYIGNNSSNVPISAIALVTCRSSMPTKAVEFTVRPSNPEKVSKGVNRSGDLRRIRTTNALFIKRPA